MMDKRPHPIFELTGQNLQFKMLQCRHCNAVPFAEYKDRRIVNNRALWPDECPECGYGFEHDE